METVASVSEISVKLIIQFNGWTSWTNYKQRPYDYDGTQCIICKLFDTSYDLMT